MLQAEVIISLYQGVSEPLFINEGIYCESNTIHYQATSFSTYIHIYIAY